MIVRLTMQHTDDGLRAEISKRNDLGQRLKGGSQVFLATSKEEARKKAKDVARGLGLKTYRVVDKT